MYTYIPSYASKAFGRDNADGSSFSTLASLIFPSHPREAFADAMDGQFEE